MAIKTLYWHENILVKNGISDVGTEKGFLYLIIISWQLNLIQIAVRHRGTTNPISCYTIAVYIRLRDTSNPVRYFILSPF